MADKYWRTKIIVEVLTSGDGPPCYNTLQEIAYDTQQGDASGVWSEESHEISPVAMAQALLNQGTDVEFLMPELEEMREAVGNVLEEEIDNLDILRAVEKFERWTPEQMHSLISEGEDEEAVKEAKIALACRQIEE